MKALKELDIVFNTQSSTAGGREIADPGQGDNI